MAVRYNASHGRRMTPSRQAQTVHTGERLAQADTVQAWSDWLDAPKTAAHAPGTSARVRLERVDDVAGLDVAAPTTGLFGLAGLREQAALIGARLACSRAPIKGRRIVLAFEA